MTRKQRILLLSLVLVAALTLTAITATMDVTDSGGDGTVDVGHSPLFIETVDSTSVPNGNVTATVGTTARGLDRVTVTLEEDIDADDELRLRPDLDNTADRPLFVRLSTNTSESINLTDVNSADPAVSELTRVSPINAEPRVFEFRLDEGAKGARLSIDYNVTGDAAGNRGQFDIGLSLDPLPDA